MADDAKPADPAVAELLAFLDALGPGHVLCLFVGRPPDVVPGREPLCAVLTMPDPKERLEVVSPRHQVEAEGLGMLYERLRDLCARLPEFRAEAAQRRLEAELAAQNVNAFNLAAPEPATDKDADPDEPPAPEVIH
jgi:hypothetical protein